MLSTAWSVRTESARPVRVTLEVIANGCYDVLGGRVEDVRT